MTQIGGGQNRNDSNSTRLDSQDLRDLRNDSSLRESVVSEAIHKEKESGFKASLAMTNKTNTDSHDSLQNYKKLNYNSLSDDEKCEGYIFHILSDKVSIDSRTKLANLAKDLSQIYPCEIEIHICDDSVFSGLPKFRGNNLAFYRILIANFLPNSVKLCLYLDTDMLVFGDLRGLFSLDLSNKYAGMVWLHDFTIEIFAKNPQDKNFSFDDFYFNSGFLFFNLAEWRKYDLTNKVLDFANKYRILGPDQDALNGVIRRANALILPYNYNMRIALIYPSGLIWQDHYIQKFPYTAEQIKSAYCNPMIWHFVDALEKPWNGGLSGVDDKGKVLEMYWWQVAWNVPYFSDELKAIFTTKRDNYLICKDFGLYLANLINKNSQSFVGNLKMPFVVWSAFKDFDLNRNYALDSRESCKSIDKNVAFEFMSVATRAWGRTSNFERIFKFALLPLRIYRAKKRCKKGIFKAQKGNLIYKLYVEYLG